MSGDVQPRKRKDKRRKKDEDDVGTPPPTLVNPSSEKSTDNVTIHVHKEDGTGGHWCARIIFFALLSVLVGLVGIIIFEHRGSTDVDTPISDSRWAMIFDGWVDDIIPQHDEEPHEEASGENSEHDEEETEEDEKGDHEEEEEKEEEEEQEEEEEETEENVADKDSLEVDKEEDEGIGSEEEEEEEEEDEDENEHEGHHDEDDQQSVEEDQQSVEKESFQRNVYASRREVTSNERLHESREENSAENDEGFDEDNSDENGDDFGTLEELGNASDESTNEDEIMNNSEENEEEEENDEGEQEQDKEEEDKEEEEMEADNKDNDLDVSIEGVRASRENDEEDDISQEYFSIPGVGEIDENSIEPLEEIEESDLEEIVNELEIEPDEEQEIEEETTSVAVKFGVGVALIVAAHFVLVRRWNNVEGDLAGGSYGEAVDLARRNTIVPPLNPKDLITKNEDQSAIRDEKIAETYEQLGDKYKSLETENSKGSSKGEVGNPQLRHVSMPEKAVHDAKITSAKIVARGRKREEEMEEAMTSESERQSATEAEEEDEEVSEEEEEEEDDEDEELEDEEIEEPDDRELVAKLEAKYGKLPTPTESEDEEDYDDEDEEDEEEPEDEDAEIQGWKRVKAPQGPRSGGPTVEQRREAREKDQPKKGTSGSQSADKNVHGSVNDSSFDEVTIQEEINNWPSKEFDN